MPKGWCKETVDNKLDLRFCWTMSSPRGTIRVENKDGNVLFKPVIRFYSEILLFSFSDLILVLMYTAMEGLSQKV